MHANICNCNLQGCQSGKRSELACLDLQAAVSNTTVNNIHYLHGYVQHIGVPTYIPYARLQGFKKVKNMGGGYLAWLHHGFPVVPSHMEEDDAPPPAPGSQA